MFILIANVVSNDGIVETKEYADFPFVPAMHTNFLVRNTLIAIDRVDIDPIGLAGTPIVTISGRVTR